jgi:hypothetical protein
LSDLVIGANVEVLNVWKSGEVALNSDGSIVIIEVVNLEGDQIQLGQVKVVENLG